MVRKDLRSIWLPLLRLNLNKKKKKKNQIISEPLLTSIRIDYRMKHNNNNNNKKEITMKTVIHYNSSLKTVNVHNVTCVVTSTGKVIGTIANDGKFRQDPLVVRTMQIEYDNA